MTARNDDARDEDAVYAGAGYAGAEHDGIEPEGVEYDGIDALMAALIDEPLPAEALRDPGFMTAHREAAADVALLRKQLGLLGEALAREGEAEADDEAGAQTGAPAGRAAAARPGGGTQPAQKAAAETTAPSPVTPLKPANVTRPTRETAPEPAAHASTSPSGPEGESPAGRESGAGAGGGAAMTPLPVRARRSRRAAAAAFKGLAAAAVAAAVVGMGWLVVRNGAGNGDAGGSAADTSASRPHSQEDSKTGHAGYLACARLVVEGTVVAVEAVPGTGQDRVTLDVERYYKPGKGEERIVFPMAEDTDPRLREGDHVLIGISRGQAQPDLWSTEEQDIARERAWIVASLPESRSLRCE